VYHPCVPTGSTESLKTKNFTFFRALRQTLVEGMGLSARCLKPRDFNGFQPADLEVCTSHVYLMSSTSRHKSKFESVSRLRGRFFIWTVLNVEASMRPQTVSPTDDLEMMRLPAVKRTTGLATSSVYALIAEGEFPKPVALSIRRVAWARVAEDHRQGS
jgi:prophage regulatory protein